jgi:aminoglycoside 6'-N-acetyltransferase
MLAIVTAVPATKGNKTMPTQFETERLIIRHFATNDWPAVPALARDMVAGEGAKYDRPWPADDKGSRGLTEFFVNDPGSWAVCVKKTGKLVGLIRFNGIEMDQRLDLGHLFLTTVAGEDYASEAIRRMVDHAFTQAGIESIVFRNAEARAVQVAPLKKLAMKITGKGEMGITKTEWLERKWQPKIVQREAMTILGVRQRFSFSKGPHPKTLWEGEFMKHHAQRSSR